MRGTKFSLGVVLGVLLAACSAEAAGDSSVLSDEAEAYLASVGQVEDQFGEGFDTIQTAITRAYPTREVFFGAIRDAGVPGTASIALTRAQALTPPDEFEADHRDWVAYRQLVSDLGADLDLALDQRDMKEVLDVMTRLEQAYGSFLVSAEREVCEAIAFSSDLCPADELPGGDYGEQVHEILRLNNLSNLGLFRFVADMSPEERAMRLEDVQPLIEAHLKAGGDALKEINPPEEFETDHAAFIRYFEEQHATAVAITVANAAGDVDRVLALFDESGAVVRRLTDSLSPEYGPIAAPFLADE